LLKILSHPKRDVITVSLRILQVTL